MPENIARPEITVITPMYNEGAHIAENVRRILGALDTLDASWEYILIDDGSVDSSLHEATAELADNPACRIIHYPINRGRGYALRRGFAAARGRYIITTESDLSWGPQIVPQLYERLRAGDCDIVSASVYLPSGGFERVPAGRRWLSAAGNQILRWCFGNGLTMLSGMTRGYRREVLETLYLESDRKEIHVEIVSKALALGYRVVEVPATIRWAPPGSGRRRGNVGGMLRYIAPHLVSSYNQGATRILLWGTALLFLLGLGTVVFGTANKLFTITPQPMPNLVLYGFVLILLAGLCALFAGVSIQLSSLTRSLTHVQAQLQLLSQRAREPSPESTPAESPGDAEPARRQFRNHDPQLRDDVGELTRSPRD